MSVTLALVVGLGVSACSNGSHKGAPASSPSTSASRSTSVSRSTSASPSTTTVVSSTTVVRQATSATVDQLLATGVKQAQAKQYSQAKVTFQDVLTLNPGNEYAWYNLGLIAQTQKDPKLAVSDYQRALKTDPRYTSAMYNEAIALEPSDPQRALSLYKQIVGINHKAATAYLRMSFVYDRLGDKKQAATARRQAIALDPALRSVPPPKK